MINTQKFYEYLNQNNVDFYTGVPDSLLKDICAYITDHTPKERNIIAANEGGAIALATGYHLATGKTPLVYMQNSGVGNAINPLLSLADKEVYSIPMLVMIGWRGEPGIKDEPQHAKQGRVTIPMLESMEIPYFILDENCDYSKIITDAVNKANEQSAPVSLLVKKHTFEPYKLSNTTADIGSLSREDALEKVLNFLPENSIVVSTTGMLSRELFELREKYLQSHESDFLTVGSMGHASQIALGIALAMPKRKVFCFDGDGAIIMHSGNMGIIGCCNVANYYHFVFNNSAHDSVGGQPTIGKQIDFKKLAEANNYKSFFKINTEVDVEQLEETIQSTGPVLVEVQIKKGARKDLGRPTSTPIENKNLFKSYIQK